MKAWMLCLSFICTGNLTMAAQGKDSEKISFNQLIDHSEKEAQTAHLKALPKDQTIASYNYDWLRLRQSKRTALAQAEIHLKTER